MIDYDKLVAPVIEEDSHERGEENAKAIVAYYKGELSEEDLNQELEKGYDRPQWAQKGKSDMVIFLEEMDQQICEQGTDGIDMEALQRIYSLHAKHAGSYIIEHMKGFSSNGLVRYMKEFSNGMEQMNDRMFDYIYFEEYNRNFEPSKFIPEFKDLNLVKQLILNIPRLKQNGKWYGLNNLEALLKISEIGRALKNEEFDKLNEMFVDTVLVLCDDYCKESYLFGESSLIEPDIVNLEYRLSMSDDEKKTMSDLLCGKISVEDAYQSLIQTFHSTTCTTYGDTKYTFFDVDKDVKSLLSLTEDTDLANHSPASANLNALFKKINPYYFATEVIRSELRGEKWCELRPYVEFVEKYPVILEQSSDRDNMVEAVFIYAILHIDCWNDEPNHMRIIQYLIDCHGEEYIVGIVDKIHPAELANRAYAALRLIVKSSLVEDVVAKRDEAYIKRFAKDNAVCEESQAAIEDFLRGTRDENIDINTLLVEPSKITGIDQKLLTSSTFANYFELIAKTGDRGLIASRIKASQEKYIPSNQFHKVLELFLEKGLDVAPAFDVLCIPELKYKEEHERCYEGITLLHNRGINCFALAKTFHADCKIKLLMGLANASSPTRDVDAIIEWFGAKEKGVQQQLQLFVRNAKNNTSEEDRIQFIEALSNATIKAKRTKEQGLVQAIIHFKPSREQLDKIFKSLTEAVSRELVLDYLDISIEEMEGEGFNFDSYLNDVHNAKTKFAAGIFDIQLPQRKDGADARLATEVLLQSYMACREDRLNKEGILIAEYLDQDSLAKFTAALYKLWMIKKDAKLKWMMVPAMIHGDGEMVGQIIKDIIEFADNKRGKLASFMAMSASLRGDRQILMGVDKIRRTTKYKSLRHSAIEALELAARERKISRYELNDTLSCDHGFENGPATLEHGDETLKFHLQPDFTLIIERPDGKLIKSIPKADDAATLKQSKTFFSELKKTIKEEVTVQTSNLEEAYCKFRLWDGAYFQQYIEKNLFVRQLAQTLVWGVYSDYLLKDTFYINDGFKTIDDEEFVIPEDARIAIVHPVDFDQAANAQWQAKLNGLNVTQVFDQLEREIITIDNPDDFQITYPFSRKSPSTVIERLRKKGWNMGSVCDGGSFHEFFTEIPELNLEVEMTFDEYANPSEYGFEMDTDDGLAGVKMVEFYKPGSVERGSYIYDEIKEENTYRPSELIPRVVNEMMATIKRAFE
ncbi:DUF4132 domain-containing protein [Saccharicrinis aurantiacus]|uniref:DUF4132 domain-containing protein n=1 Tax=Saccharicrinis aurantiacus TaxID=1849719 RepID=UPI00094F59A4|nr:DUF4132 domain-containing protein [Saccharicrinis aurantiacus]